jgi:ABC-type lipoprotein export system ATPase subunit
MREAASATALQFRDVEKQYGALRPLRIHDLRIALGSCVTLVGFDQPAAEAFVNLATGATLPEKGEVASLGESTAGIPNSDAWLSFVERIGIVSHRIVLLEGLSIAQNLAIPFDLELDPIPPQVLPRVTTLAAEVDIAESMLDKPVAEVDLKTRARVVLARALALDPALLLLEHPAAALPPDEAKGYAVVLRKIWERRKLTLVLLTMDEKFGRALGGIQLKWQPSTGELQERRRWF